jgi:hypothetical protein
MYVGSSNTCIDLWLDVAGVPSFLAMDDFATAGYHWSWPLPLLCLPCCHQRCCRRTESFECGSLWLYLLGEPVIAFCASRDQPLYPKTVIVLRCDVPKPSSL